jgi:ankyrin repeat protein
MTPLHYAAYKGHPDVVKALIDANANPNLAHVRPALWAARPSRSPASHGCLALPPCSAPVLRDGLN